MTTLEAAADAYYNAKNHADIMKRRLKMAKGELEIAKTEWEQAHHNGEAVLEDFLLTVASYQVGEHMPLVEQTAVHYQKAKVEATRAQLRLFGAENVVKKLETAVNLSNNVLADAHKQLLEVAENIHIEVTE